VLDALIDRKNRDVAGLGEAAGVHDEVEISEDVGGTVGGDEDSVDEVGAGEVKEIAFETFGGVGEKGIGVGAEEID
jgi:hypothetical protein